IANRKHASVALRPDINRAAGANGIEVQIAAAIPDRKRQGRGRSKMNHSDHGPERYDKVRREMDHAIFNGRQNAHGTADRAMIVAVAIGTWHDIDDLDRQPVARLDA